MIGRRGPRRLYDRRCVPQQHHRRDIGDGIRGASARRPPALPEYRILPLRPRLPLVAPLQPLGPGRAGDLGGEARVARRAADRGARPGDHGAAPCLPARLRRPADPCTGLRRPGHRDDHRRAVRGMRERAIISGATVSDRCALPREVPVAVRGAARAPTEPVTSSDRSEVWRFGPFVVLTRRQARTRPAGLPASGVLMDRPLGRRPRRCGVASRGCPQGSSVRTARQRIHEDPGHRR